MKIIMTSDEYAKMTSEAVEHAVKMAVANSEVLSEFVNRCSPSDSNFDSLVSIFTQRFIMKKAYADISAKRYTSFWTIYSENMGKTSITKYCKLMAPYKDELMFSILERSDDNE